MFPQSTNWRPLGTVNYSSNQKVRLEITRGPVLRELELRLKGQLTCVAGSNLAASVLRGDEGAVVKGISLVVNGNIYLRQLSWHEWATLQHYDYGFPPMPTAALGDGATANPSFDTTLLIGFWKPNKKFGFDTCFDTRKYSKVELEIEFGTHTDVIAAATGFTTAPYVEVNGYEAFGLPADAVFDLETNSSINWAQAAANTKATYSLPVGDEHVYRALLINVRDNASPAVDSQTVVTNLKVTSGPRVFFDKPVISHQHATWTKRRMVTGFDYGSAAQQRLTRGQKTHQNGWVLIDFGGNDGLEHDREYIDTTGFSELKLEANVSAAGEIRIFPLYQLPGRG